MKKILYLIFLILFSVSAYANFNWYQEANADYVTIGGNSYIGYASNFAGATSNFSQCGLGINTNYNSLAADFTLAGYSQILVFDANTLYFYDTNCDLLGITSIGATIQDQPVIMNTDGDSYPEVIILTSTDIHKIEYQTLSSTFEIIDSISTSTSYEALTCLYSRDKCYLFNEGDRNVSSVDLDTGAYTLNLNLLTYAYDDLPAYSSLSSVSQTTGAGTIYYTLVCGMTYLTNANMYCNMIKTDIYGNATNSATITMSGFGAKPSALKQVNGFGAKLGSNLKFFVTACDDVRGGFNAVYDVSGTQIFSSGYNAYCDDQSSFSNWAVADYNKDGQNEACYVGHSNAAISNGYLYCIDAFANPLYNTSFGSAANKTYSLALMDFNNSKSTLGVVTVGGVYYPNSTVELQKVYNTGESPIGVYAKLGITFTGLSQINGFWYSGNSVSALVFPTFVSVVCGDDACDGLENSLTCPQDCSLNSTGILNATGFPCVNDSDCAFGKCLYNTCSLLGSYEECNSDNDCISGSCIHGKCSKVTLWEQIDYSKTENFGDDANTNNLLAFIIMITVAVGIGAAIGKFSGWIGGAIGVISFYAIGFFFAITGWLSPFAIFGLIISFIGLIGLSMFLNGE